MTACSNDDDPLSGGNFTPYRLDIKKGETLTLLGGDSRADDEYSTGLFKVDANGNVSAVETIVRYDEDDNATTEKVKVQIVPTEIINVDENFMILMGCQYRDDKGTYYPVAYNDILVRKSDGLVYSLDNVKNGAFWPGFAFLADTNDKFYLSEADWLGSGGSNPIISLLTVSNGQCTLEDLTTADTPVPRGMLFKMDGEKIAATDIPLFIASSIITDFPYSSFGLWPARRATVVYPNGGYETFGNTSYGFTLALLNNSVLEISSEWTTDPNDNSEGYECRWIHLGNSYGESTTEKLELIKTSGIASWYEGNDKILLKSDSSIGGKFIVLDKATKKFTYTDISFSDADNLELWAKNLDGDRFYGLIKNSNDQIVKACWLNPNTLAYGEIDLNLDDIDITTILPDYKNGKAQLIGTRRSDGYKVAASVDLRNGTTKTLFSVPDRNIVTLIQLN